MPKFWPDDNNQLLPSILNYQVRARGQASLVPNADSLSLPPQESRLYLWPPVVRQGGKH